MIDKELIIQKLKREYSDKSEHFYAKKSDEIVSDCFPEFEQNLLEWCNDQPLTEIPIYENGCSIKSLMQAYPFASFDYILKAIKRTKNTNHPELISIWFTQNHL